jgi:hypothetical protein
MSVTSQEDDGVMGGDERKRKIRSKSLSGPKLEGGNLEKGQCSSIARGKLLSRYVALTSPHSHSSHVKDRLQKVSMDT